MVKAVKSFKALGQERIFFLQESKKYFELPSIFDKILRHILVRLFSFNSETFFSSASKLFLWEESFFLQGACTTKLFRTELTLQYNKLMRFVIASHFFLV